MYIYNPTSVDDLMTMQDGFPAVNIYTTATKGVKKYQKFTMVKFCYKTKSYKTKSSLFITTYFHTNFQLKC